MTQLHHMQKNNGFALVAALFLIIVLAALGLFAMKISSTQQQSIDLELLGTRAQAAANSGIEYATNQFFSPYYNKKNKKKCVSGALALNQPAFTGFNLSISCTPSTQRIKNSAPACKGNNCNVFEITATATYGTYGTADYVSRRQTRTVTDAPLP